MYPNGPWGPDSHIQRGGIVYDFRVPGDPLTPGWASVPGAPRIKPADAVSLPKIVSVPLSWHDARPILEALRAGAPSSWQGGSRLESSQSQRSDLWTEIQDYVSRRRGTGDGAPAGAERRQGPADLDGDRTHHRHRRPGSARDRRQPPRRVGLRRRRSVERHGVADGAGAIAGHARDAGHASEADDRVRELGRRRVLAHLVDRVGRAARARARRPRRRLSQRRQLRVGPGFQGVGGAGAEPASSRRARATCSGSRRATTRSSPTGSAADPTTPCS